MSVRKALALLVAALLLATASFAQSTTGIIRGILTDASGAIIPAATVTLTAADKTQRSATTQSDGSYVFTGITPGGYSVHVEYPGFNAYDKPVTVEAARTAQLPIRLAL